MKKLFAIILLIVMLVIPTILYASSHKEETFQLEFTWIQKNKNEKTEVYMLLPVEYLKIALEKDGISQGENVIDTVKKYSVTAIPVSKEAYQEKSYEEEGKEYLQIKLEPQKGEPKGSYTYEFPILSEYPSMDMKFRIKSSAIDNLIHIDNFKTENGICKIEYNEATNVVKQPDKKIFTIATILLIIVLILVAIIGSVAYIKQRR